MFVEFYQYLGIYAFFLPVASLILCAVLVAVSAYMPRLSGRSYDLSSVQAIHSKPTSRIGGVGIFVILCATVFLAPPSVASPYAYFILATCLLFVVGLLEDTGTPVSPRMRLLACVATSAIVIAMFNTWLPRLGVPGFDPLMSHALVGIPVTLFVTAGVANGFNLIDGVNGLAAFTAMVSAICLAMIAYQVGISEMVILALMLAAAISGFFVLNFPFGAIFLGDAGAYTIGFILSWFGIAILLAAPAASAWAILLTMFWPLADTLLAIFRRARRKADAMAPDRLHVHQMVMRVLEIHLLGRGKRHLANPLSTVVLAPFITAPALMGVAFWDHNSAAFAAVILSLAMFFGGYFAAFPVLRKMPRKRARNSDVTEEREALQES